MTSGRKTRFKAGIPAAVHYRGREYPCTAHDLSRTGVMLLGGIPWPSEETVRFRLDGPSGDLHLELTGRVARVSEDTERNGTALALEFDSLTRGEQLELEAILQRLIEGQAPGRLSGIKPDAPAAEIRKALEAIPVTQRSSLALRSIKAPERDLLRHDTHPLVLEALARNPHLLEPEILGLLNNIHLMPRTLEQIAADSRWRGKPDVLLEIIGHVRTPPPLAERLLSEVPVPAVRRLMMKPNLHAGLKNKIRQLLL